MPKLTVGEIRVRDVYKDIARIAKKYRVGEDGEVIEESTVCWIDGTPKGAYVVVRGNDHSERPEILVDSRTRSRLGVVCGQEYEVTLRRASFFGELYWAWTASETGYRVACRIAVIGLVLGLISLVPVVVEWINRTRAAFTCP